MVEWRRLGRANLLPVPPIRSPALPHAECRYGLTFSWHFRPDTLCLEVNRIDLRRHRRGAADNRSAGSGHIIGMASTGAIALSGQRG
jgi:hypothetical protein